MGLDAFSLLAEQRRLSVRAKDAVSKLRWPGAWWLQVVAAD